MKIIISLLLTILITSNSKAQSWKLDSAKNEIYRINKLFDSSSYLGFDLDLVYRADTNSVIISTDQLSGNYVLNNKNVYYRMGGIEYVQTDSFSYNIYSDEKMMVMTKNVVSETSGLFPLKAFLDSVLTEYGGRYEIDSLDIEPNDSLRRIKFKIINGEEPIAKVPYKSFSLYYSTETYFPAKFEFTYNEREQDVSDSVPNLNPFYVVNKTVTMIFRGFRPYVDTQIFEDSEYVLYNRQRKIFESSEKYKDFRLMTSGFSNEDVDAVNYREIPFGSN